MNRGRIARIAFSVTCAFLCAALIVLWIHSYWYLGWLAAIPVFESHTLYGSLLLWFDNQPVNAYLASDITVGHTPVNEANTTAESFAFLNGRGVLGFGRFYDSRNTLTLLAPLWAFVLVIAGLAVAPWIKWSRRFSLRMLLVVTTVVAVVLGVVVVAMRP
jgi:hypothetical protein